MFYVNHFPLSASAVGAGFGKRRRLLIAFDLKSEDPYKIAKIGAV